MASFLVQALAVQTRFNLHPLSEAPDGWSRALAALRELPRFAVVALTSLVLIGGKSLSEDLDLLFRASETVRNRWAWVALQTASFAALWTLGCAVFERPLDGDPLPGVLALGFFASGLTCVGVTCLAIAPSSAWADVLRRRLRLLLGSALAGLAAWGAGMWSQDGLREVLRRPTLHATGFLLRPFVAEPILDEASFSLGTSKFVVSIAPQCSGLDGVGLILAFTLVWLVWMRRELRFPQALLLLPIGAITAWLSNAVRLSLLVLIGDRISPDLAVDGFHSAAGMVLFCGIAIAVVVLGHRAPFGAGSASGNTWVDSTVAHLLPLMLWVSAGLMAVLVAASPTTQLGVRLALVALALAALRREFREHIRIPTLAGLLMAVTSAGIALLLPRAQQQGLMVAREATASMAAYLAAIGTLLVVPVVEELAFRGYLLRRIQSDEFDSIAPGTIRWPSILASSVGFGLLHPAWPAAACLGVLYALAYIWKGRLVDAILAHAATNLALMMVPR